MFLKWDYKVLVCLICIGVYILYGTWEILHVYSQQRQKKAEMGQKANVFTTNDQVHCRKVSSEDR